MSFLQSISLSLPLLCAFYSTPHNDSVLEAKLKSLDSLSIGEHLAFYELYSETIEGQKALQHASCLLAGPEKNNLSDAISRTLSLSRSHLHALISLITGNGLKIKQPISNEHLSLIEELGCSLANRYLKGHSTWDLDEVRGLPQEEIDLSRALLIEIFDQNREEIRQYEAALDLMALQIKGKLNQHGKPSDWIREINHFVFQELGFRFPPKSFLRDRDDYVYTLLPAVMDSREGVCLGVSILYLSLAQRLGLPLEIVIPPGHIYLRYRDEDNLINIETTARGIHLPCETYLGIDIRKLEETDLRSVIGLNFQNQAASIREQGDYLKTIEILKKSSLYLEDHPKTKLWLGLNYLFAGEKEEGEALLKDFKDYTFEHKVSKETLVDDYFQRRIDISGIELLYMQVDEHRESLIEKQSKLSLVLNEHPFFREGLLQMAHLWLQLGSYAEALKWLERYHEIDASHPNVEYLLSCIYLERWDYEKAWKHLKIAEQLLEARQHQNQILINLRDQLRRLSPDLKT